MFQLLHVAYRRDWFVVAYYFSSMYNNDISESSKLPWLLLFAGDTNLFYSHRNPELLNETANQELCKVADWLRANKISLNIDVFHCDVNKL